LLKGLAVLEALVAPGGRPRTIDELSREINLTRSNVHRTLQTLAFAGYVRKDDTLGRYHPTMKLLELGARQLASLDIRHIALPFMRILAHESGETVHLSILEGITVVYIDKIDSPQPVRSYTEIGGRAPAYAVATGKALLANQPEGYIDRFEGQLQRHTTATIAGIAELKAELARIRELGYAVNHGEWRATVGGLAVGVFDGFDRVVAALGISGPLERLEKGRFAALAPQVRELAGEISKAMGARLGPVTSEAAPIRTTFA
jgi:DNA-binding IclR family transcriptional regulator